AGPATKESPFTYIGFWVYRWASSARTRIAAAAPSLTPEQSKTPSCPAINGAFWIVSFGTSLRNWARGLRAPLAWFFQAMRVITSLSASAETPYFFAYAGAGRLNI